MIFLLSAGGGASSRTRRLGCCPSHSANLSTAWEKVSPVFIQRDKDEMKAIEVGLSRLQAFLQSQDRSQALATAAEIREHWDHLNE